MRFLPGGLLLAGMKGRERRRKWERRRCCLHPVAWAVTVARPLMLFSLFTVKERKCVCVCVCVCVSERERGERNEGGGMHEGAEG